MLSSSPIWKRQATMSRRRPKGWPCVCGVAWPRKRKKLSGRASHQACELVEQPALADAGIGHHADGGETAIDEQPLEGVLKRLELGVPADHPRRHAFDAAAAEAKAPRLGAQHQVALDRLVHALDRQRLLPLDLEQAAHLRVGVVADAQAPGRRGLLHPCGDVHRDAANAAIGIHAAAEQHAAGVDADANVEAFVTVRRPHFGAERLAEVEQGQAAAHGALGVVFLGFVGAEGGQDAVAGVLQDLAGMRLDDGRAACQGVVHDGADRLGVEVLSEGGRADHVEEQDADLPEALCRHRRRCGRAGQRLELGPRGRQE